MFELFHAIINCISGFTNVEETTNAFLVIIGRVANDFIYFINDIFWYHTFAVFTLNTVEILHLSNFRALMPVSCGNVKKCLHIFGYIVRNFIIFPIPSAHKTHIPGSTFRPHPTSFPELK